MFVKLCVGSCNGRSTEEVSLSAIVRVTSGQGGSEVHVLQPMRDRMEISGEKDRYYSNRNYQYYYVPKYLETNRIRYYAPHEPETVRTALAMYERKLLDKPLGLLSPSNQVQRSSLVWTLDLTQPGKLEMTSRIMTESADRLTCGDVSIDIKRPDDSAASQNPRTLTPAG